MHTYPTKRWTFFLAEGAWPHIRRSTGIIALILLAHINTCLADESRKVLLLLSGNSPVYQNVAANTIKRIDRFCATRKIICRDLQFEQKTVSENDTMIPNDTFATVTFGTRAAEAVTPPKPGNHLILSMLPRQSMISGKRKFPLGNVSKIYIDQPYERYFELIRATIPRAARVGLLLHVSEFNQSPLLLQAAEESGLTLKIEYIEDTQDIGESLSHLLYDIDAFLAIPDSRIHNNKTISNILTTAYRNNIPVVAFSSAYVKAGATEAIYTSLDDIAHQVSDVVSDLLTNDSARPSVQQAKYFSVSFNFEVARSLGLYIGSPSEIESIIKRNQKQ